MTLKGRNAPPYYIQLFSGAGFAEANCPPIWPVL